jgi:hypothetical protein
VPLGGTQVVPGIGGMDVPILINYEEIRFFMKKLLGILS